MPYAHFAWLLVFFLITLNNFLVVLFVFWLHWVFVAMRGLSLVVASGGGGAALHCGAGLLIAVASLVAGHGL